MGTFFSYIKSILAVVGLVKDLLEWFRKWRNGELTRRVEEQNSEVRSVNEQIKEEASKEEPDDEIIKDLHRRLNDIANKQL